jgi:hypothetical protein
MTLSGLSARFGPALPKRRKRPDPSDARSWLSHWAATEGIDCERLSLAEAADRAVSRLERHAALARRRLLAHHQARTPSETCRHQFPFPRPPLKSPTSSPTSRPITAAQLQAIRGVCSLACFQLSLFLSAGLCKREECWFLHLELAIFVGPLMISFVGRVLAYLSNPTHQIQPIGVFTNIINSIR